MSVETIIDPTPASQEAQNPPLRPDPTLEIRPDDIGESGGILGDIEADLAQDPTYQKAAAALRLPVVALPEAPVPQSERTQRMTASMNLGRRAAAPTPSAPPQYDTFTAQLAPGAVDNERSPIFSRLANERGYEDRIFAPPAPAQQSRAIAPPAPGRNGGAIAPKAETLTHYSDAQGTPHEAEDRAAIAESITQVLNRTLGNEGLGAFVVITTEATAQTTQASQKSEIKPPAQTEREEIAPVVFSPLTVSAVPGSQMFTVTLPKGEVTTTTPLPVAETAPVRFASKIQLPAPAVKTVKEAEAPALLPALDPTPPVAPISETVQLPAIAHEQTNNAVDVLGGSALLAIPEDIRPEEKAFYEARANLARAKADLAICAAEMEVSKPAVAFPTGEEAPKINPLAVPVMGAAIVAGLAVATMLTSPVRTPTSGFRRAAQAVSKRVSKIFRRS